MTLEAREGDISAPIRRRFTASRNSGFDIIADLDAGDLDDHSSVRGKK
jgi:hypothetical protein